MNKIILISLHFTICLYLSAYQESAQLLVPHTLGAHCPVTLILA